MLFFFIAKSSFRYFFYLIFPIILFQILYKIITAFSWNILVLSDYLAFWWLIIHEYRVILLMLLSRLTLSNVFIMLCLLWFVSLSNWTLSFEIWFLFFNWINFIFFIRFHSFKINFIDLICVIVFLHWIVLILILLFLKVLILRENFAILNV